MGTRQEQQRKALIIGNHPLVDSLKRQYGDAGWVVEHWEDTVRLPSATDLQGLEELCLLSDIKREDSGKADHEVIALLGTIAERLEETSLRKRKQICHLLVQRPSTLRMLQTTDFCEAIRKKVDVYPFTMDEVWSRSITLDYQPITIQSEKHVHLVIFGMNEIAEMVAIQAAYVAHYPNYTRDHSLRTRITLIDKQAEQKSVSFISNYQHLFDNSFYRIVKPSEEKKVTTFHHPMYEGRREDFVDVEWEFVAAESWNVDLREKLRLWATDEKQLLTVVMANRDAHRNMSEAFHLPDEIYQRAIPLYIYSKEDVRMDRFPNIRCFGMEHQGYDVTLPLVRMAKNVNYIYDRCYEENFKRESATDEHLLFAVEIDPEERDRSWARLPMVKRMSSMCNAMAIATKMRSVGLDACEWEKFYDIPQQDIELLTEVEHNRWSVEELILGYRPCTDDEQQQIEADISLKRVFKARRIHYDLRAYDDLRLDETGKSVKIYDLCLCSCLPLIAKAFADEKGGEL